MALTMTPINELGTEIPSFEVTDVFGKQWKTSDFQTGKPALIFFICNHCPYVKAIEDRLITLGSELKKLQIPLLAISSNDPSDYPEDSPEEMKSRAVRKSYSFPYAFDEDQSLAKKFAAVCTPDFFLYDGQGKLAYRGRLDDSWKDASKVTKQELLEAAKNLLANQEVAKQTPSMGCSIKWKAN